MCHKKKNKGFTLMELIVYLSISSILLIAIGGVAVDVLFLKAKAETFNNVAYNSRMLMSQLEYLIKDAETIISPSRTMSGNNLLFSTSGSNVTINNYNGRIRVVKGSNPAYYLTDDKVVIENLQFYNVSASSWGSSVRVSFKVSASSSVPLREYNYSNNFFVTLNSKLK